MSDLQVPGVRATARLLALLAFCLMFAAPVAAQLDTPGHLLSAVQPSRVTQVNATQGMLNNSRIWRGDAAADVVSTLRGYDATFTATTRIQAYTWDWYRNAPRTDVTPMVFLVITLEEWATYCGPVPEDVGEGDVWLRRWLSQCAPGYQRTNTLACYDVGDPAVYDCHQYQGGMERQFEASHINYLTVTRAVGDEIAAALMERRSNGMESLFGFAEFWEYLGAALGGALALAVIAWVLPFAVKRGIDVIFYLRKYRPQIFAAVDQPTDPVNVLIDKALDLIKPGNYGKVSSVVLYSFVRALLGELERHLDIPKEPEKAVSEPQ